MAKKDKENTQSEKKEKKSAKREPNNVEKCVKDLRIDLKKAVWPTRETVVNNTAVVLAVVVGSALIVGALDFGSLHLLSFIYQQG